MIGKKEPVFRGRLENLPSAAAALTSSHDGSRRDSGIFLLTQWNCDNLRIEYYVSIQINR